MYEPAPPTVTAAPTSGQGVLQRCAPRWNTLRLIHEAKTHETPALGWTIALLAIPLVWTLTLALWALAWTWTLCVGLFTWPLRLVGRSRRKRKREEAQHAEVLDALRKASGGA